MKKNKVGIFVGGDESYQMTHGANVDPEVARYFTNQQTGQLDRAQLNQFLNTIQASKADDPTRLQWGLFITGRIEAKKTARYISLVKNGLYVNSLEAKDDYEAKNKLANFKYVTLPYTSIADNKVTITDADYQAYYDEHKATFKLPAELRTFEYITFNAAPSKNDSLAVKTTGR